MLLVKTWVYDEKQLNGNHYAYIIAFSMYGGCFDAYSNGPSRLQHYPHRSLKDLFFGFEINYSQATRKINDIT